jgi:hypothetical protein
MAFRECPYCGKMVYDQLTQCNYCRERLPEVWQPRSLVRRPLGSNRIRRGLLFMLAAAAIGYFAGGASAWVLPLVVPTIVADYLLPLLFLSGLGLSLHGLYLRHWASH